MFASTSNAIAEGDLVILYYGRENTASVIVEEGKDVNSRYGHFKHKDMIGTPYGTKFPSSNGRGFVYLLRPTPELWTQALPHRTQILYMPDIAFICSFLGLGPGSKVIEAGTGSGSFSHSVARTIGETGTLYSYEFHEERYKEAQAEFKAHKLDQIKLQHRNVCKDGFGDDAEQDLVDAVFLDLPSPWEAVEAAKAVMKKDRPSRICCFSPCIEQVIRTVTSLGAHGFSEITMYEALSRQWEPVAAVAEGTPLTVQDVITRLKSVVVKKDARRLIQISKAQAKRDAKKEAKLAEAVEGGIEVDGSAKEASTSIAGAEASSTTKESTLGAKDGETAKDQSEENNEAAERPAKRPRLDVDSPSASTAPASEADTSKPNGAKKNNKNKHHIADNFILKPQPQLRGHTSYLTFATLMPSPVVSVKHEESTQTEVSTQKSTIDASLPSATLPASAPEEPLNNVTEEPKPNGLRKMESLVELPQEDAAMYTEGVSFSALPNSLEK